MKSLLAAKADVNLPDKNGVTPLYAAAALKIEGADQVSIERNKLAVVKQLVDAGADVTQNLEGQRVSQWAQQNTGYSTIIAYLKSSEIEVQRQSQKPPVQGVFVAGRPSLPSSPSPAFESKPAAQHSALGPAFFALMLSPKFSSPEAITINFSIRYAEGRPPFVSKGDKSHVSTPH